MVRHLYRTVENMSSVPSYSSRLLLRAHTPWHNQAAVLVSRHCKTGTTSYTRGIDSSFGGRPSLSATQVLHMDNQMLWVNKPSGLLSQGDRTGDADVLGLAREYIRVAANKPGEAFVAMVHRLDRPVSGVMCIARTSKAAARLSANFRDRVSVDKIYHAVVAGKLSGSGTCEDFLVPIASNDMNDAKGWRGPRTIIAQEDTAAMRLEKGEGEGVRKRTAGAADAAGSGQLAVLEWRAVHHLNSANSKLCRPVGGGEDRPHTLVQIKPMTGRKHQIRAQLAAMGYPVVGDVRYGGRSSASYRSARRNWRNNKGAKNPHDRVGVLEEYATGVAGMTPLKDRSILLHASELAVPHPTRPGEVVRVWAPPPDSWAKLCGDDILRFMMPRGCKQNVVARARRK